MVELKHDKEANMFMTLEERAVERGLEQGLIQERTNSVS